MAIVVESTTTAPFASGSTSFSQNRPTGTTNGDLLVAFVFTGNDNGTTNLTVSSAPSGWTLARPVTTQTINGGSNNPVNVYVYTKIASSEPSSWTWTLSSSGASLWYAGAIMRISGASAITDSDDATVLNSPTPSFSGGVTPVSTNNLVFMATIATDVSSSATTTSAYAIATDNPSWTELLDSQNDTAGSTIHASVAYALRTQSTTTGNWTLTYSTGSAMDTASQIFIITEPVTGTITLDTPGTLTLSGNEINFITESFLTITSPGTLTLSGNDHTVAGEQKTAWSNDNKPSTTWTNE